MTALTKVDEEFLRIPRRFLADFNAEFSCEAVIFGGAVRDTLLGYQPKDIDIMIPGNPLAATSMREDITKWIRSNGLVVSNSVKVRPPYDDNGTKHFCGGPILNATFKPPMKEISIQIMSEENFVVRAYLEEDMLVSTTAVLTPQLSCNRIACDERANLFSEEDYMERLEASELGVCHTVSSDPLKVSKRIIRFFVTRDLTPDYSATEFLNTVVGWNEAGSDFLSGAISDASAEKVTKADGSEVMIDSHKKKVDLFSLLGRKMNG